MGPNIRLLGGRYWDFIDHHIPLSDKSLGEALQMEAFVVNRCIPGFLPYSLVGGPEYPLVLLKAYLAMPWAWRLFGRQFLVIANRPGAIS